MGAIQIPTVDYINIKMFTMWNLAPELFLIILTIKLLKNKGWSYTQHAYERLGSGFQTTAISGGRPSIVSMALKLQASHMRLR